MIANNTFNFHVKNTVKYAEIEMFIIKMDSHERKEFELPNYFELRKWFHEWWSMGNRLTK